MSEFYSQLAYAMPCSWNPPPHTQNKKNQPENSCTPPVVSSCLNLLHSWAGLERKKGSCPRRYPQNRILWRCCRKDSAQIPPVCISLFRPVTLQAHFLLNFGFCPFFFVSQTSASHCSCQFYHHPPVQRQLLDKKHCNGLASGWV